MTTKLSVAEIKRAVEENGSPFFSRDTMSFFGDTMKSFGTMLDVDGVTVLYRKPSATVKIFGSVTKAGRDLFNAWRFIDGDLRKMNMADIQRIYEAL